MREVTGMRRRKCKQLLDDLKEIRRYWKVKQEAPDHTLQNLFRKGLRPVIRLDYVMIILK